MKWLKPMIVGSLIAASMLIFKEPDLDTPEKIYNYLKSNIEYNTESRYPDVMKTPEELYKTKKGDCKDFANFAKHRMDEAGYLSQLVIFYNNQIDEGHMVCLFYDNGKYGVIEGSGATNPDERFDTIYDIANCDEIMLAEEDRINKKGFRIDTTLSEDCYGAFTYKDFPLKLKPMSECKFNIALK